MLFWYLSKMFFIPFEKKNLFGCSRSTAGNTHKLYSNPRRIAEGLQLPLLALNVIRRFSLIPWTCSSVCDINDKLLPIVLILHDSKHSTVSLIHATCPPRTPQIHRWISVRLTLPVHRKHTTTCC